MQRTELLMWRAMTCCGWAVKGGIDSVDGGVKIVGVGEDVVDAVGKGFDH